VTAPTAERFREKSLGELLSQIGNDSSLLMRQELQLAKAEMSEKAAAAGVGAGLGVVAAVLMLGALGAGVTASISALSYVVPVWAASLITLGGLVVLAALLGLIAALRLKAALPPVPQQAIQIGKETPHELLN
jgi:hypothetical protein